LLCRISSFYKIIVANYMDPNSRPLFLNIPLELDITIGN